MMGVTSFSPTISAISFLLLLLVATSTAAFDSQFERCPAPCSAVGPSSGNWTLYNGLDRLRQCNQTVLFDFTIFNPLSDPNTLTFIRSCTAGADAASTKAQQLLLGRESSSCGSASEKSATLHVASWGSVDTSKSTAVVAAAGSLRSQLNSAPIDCDSGYLFAYNEGAVVALYVGSKMDKVSTAGKLIDELVSTAEREGLADTFAGQICGSDRNGEHTVGLIASTIADFDLVQQAMQTWNNATCLEGYDKVTTTNITVSELPLTPPTKEVPPIQTRDDTCNYIKVVSGDSCGSLANSCGISSADFYAYNPASDLCSTLAVGQAVCCSAGSLPDFTPQPNADGTCASYTVQSGDYCSLIASNNYITVDEIESFNGNTWGWLGCSNVQLGQVICLSTGDPPMPAEVSSAICGPQVPGTSRPENWSDLASLNPCPLNSCCDIWGQCGITPDFCEVRASNTGAPGTTFCISNCGTDIVGNEQAPGHFWRIGYFEAWNSARSCLTMSADQIPTSYSHIHFAFASITTDFQVDVSAVQDQFDLFVKETDFKRILSFGGWSFSTNQDTAPIFRQGVSAAERDTFANNVVAFIIQYDLDGVDFDWEYPGATDIPGAPPGNVDDGANYLEFLQTVRSILPSGKTLSIAAPASYWYLKGFPIKEIGEVVDYVVFMTYDLHGQWDYGSPWANPGCLEGNCLRSHVNKTETEYALAMITKAGVPASKVIVGVSAYGRSFGMVDASCTGPECLFEGPNSTATPGRCTGQAGYIADAEIYEYIAEGALSWHDTDSDSDMAVYDGSSWVAYMSPETKESRASLYGSYNFGGIVEWAVDLEAFREDIVLSQEDIDLSVDLFNAALSVSNYDIQSFDSNVTDLATRLVRWTDCDINQRRDVYSGWQESWKIMNVIYAEAKAGINFNEAAAVEYLGAPSLNQAWQSDIQGYLRQLGTIQPGYVTTPLDWRIHIRCGKLSRWPCNCRRSLVASTTNRDPVSGLASITFCPAYFGYETLTAVVESGNKPELGPGIYANLATYYKNQATVWIHELLHIKWVAKVVTDYGSERTTDVKIRVDKGIGDSGYIKVYGPLATKALARWTHATGYWVNKNADNMACYALARYIQKVLGNIYPHLPLAPNWRIIGNPVMWVVDGLFAISPDPYSDTIVNSDEVDNLLWTEGECGNAGDEDDGNDINTVLNVDYEGIATEDDFPDDYVNQYNAWVASANGS